MTDIRELDPRTVERIAAGEVVERPASVVKELVENSLDADADRVDVAVDSGGKAGIRVSDDGVGMTDEEVRRAVEKHTTSKITDVEDLESGVATLGFRGEALHAIGAVSRVTVTTRPRADRDGGGGTELTVEGGEVTSVEPAGCPPGTTVEVSDLFYNVPARRKYLKQDSTEFAHVNRVVTSYALANPDVTVTLTHDGRETFATTGGGDRREAVMSVYGREVADSMIAVDARVDGTGGDADASVGGDDDGEHEDVAALPEGPLDAVSGLVSHPETTRASREYLSTYVNGRYVTDDAVRDAVVGAYDAQLAPDRYPFAVLFLDLPAGDVDVNVHPRKMRVRYAKPDAVGRQVRTAVENALRRAGLLRSSAPRGRSAPDQATITPSTSDESATDEPATDSTDDAGTADTGTDDAGTADVDTDDTPEPTADGAASRPSPDTEPTRSTSSPSSQVGSTSGDTESPSPSSGSSSTSDSASSSPHPRPSRSSATNGLDTQTTLDGDDAHTSTEYENFPALRVLGQLHDTYILAEADDGLLLIDQHAADERINYERLKAQFEGDTTTQALADPVDLELTAREAALFDGYQDALARLGFHATSVDDRTVEVRTVPGVVAESAGPEVVRDLLSDFVSGGESAEDTVEAVADELLGDLACYPSITGNTSLTDGSVVDLLSALDECENPWACPHGRPVVIQIDSEEIDDRFERDYPGH